jgi:hypothetical protein
MIEVTTDTFTCAGCGGTFDKEWSDAEAQAEYERNIPAEDRGGPVDTVCDDCYNAVMNKRFGTQKNWVTE